MSWVATGVGVATVATSLLGGGSDNSASRAARTQAQASIAASRSAAQLQDKQYQQTRSDYEPWRVAGTDAVNELSRRVQDGPGEYQQSPGYNFRLMEGNKAIERSAAARGSTLDPSTMNALQRYGQDYATNDYDNFLNRYYQSLTPFQALAGSGQTATGSTSAAGASAAALQGQYAMAPVQYAGGEQRAQAQGQANQANLWGNALAYATPIAGQWAASKF